jgi:tetratricopeptide (TPR) repeat protein
MSSRFSVWVITITSAAGMLAGPGFSQGRGGTAAPPSGTAPTTGGTPAGSTTGRGNTGLPSNTPSNTSTTPQRPVTIFLTGRVMLEEGGPPPDTVSIERVCSTSTKAEGYTDSKGYFSIELGNEKSVFQDASETSSYGGANSLGSLSGIGGNSGNSRSMGGSTSELRFSNCELRARLTGYRSQTVNLAMIRPLDNPNIGVILLHREGKDEGTTVSAVSLTAPREARHAFDKGMQANKKGKTDEAEKEFQKAVELYPHFANAWNELGRIQLSHDQKDAARRSFETAIKADPKYVNPYLQLSILQMETHQWQELADTTATALKLDPFDYAVAYLYNAVGNWNLKNLDAAEKSILEAERLDSQHTLVDVSRLKGLILVQRHDYAGAAEQMRAFLKAAPESVEAPKIRVLLGQVEKVLAQSAATASSKQDQ